MRFPRSIVPARLFASPRHFSLSHRVMAPTYLKSHDQYADLISKYDTFLLDCDGVIWGGPGGLELTPQIIPALQFLRAQGKQIGFVTNNATKSRRMYLEKFTRLGIECRLEEIFTCGSASASYLAELVPTLAEGKRGIYVIGQVGLEEELREVGLTWTGGSDPIDDVLMPYQDFTAIQPDASVGIVLFSFNMHLNYQQMCKAFTYLATNPSCQLILTNDDSTVLIPGGTCPGEGAMASVLFSARKGLKPCIVGKPHKLMLDEVHATMKFDPARTIMIGDRLETDILFGKTGNLATMLVLTGSSKETDLVGLSDEFEPDYITDMVGDLLKAAQTNGVVY